MPMVHFRELAFSALHARLRAAFPEMSGRFREIERNALNEWPSDAQFPALRCYDGGHSQAPAPAVGEVAYRVLWLVEGIVEKESADDAPTLDSAMNALHARITAAMVPPEAPILVPIVGGQLELWLEETEFQVDRMGVATSERPSLRFTVEYAFQIWTNRGAPYFETP